MIYVKTDVEGYVKTAENLKKNGCRLLTVSAVDWLNKGIFEVYFIAHSMKNNVYFKVSAEIPRNKPEIPSLSKIWRNAAMYEREAWELFKIIFKGNPMLKPLFLEEWNGPPPFRKDFNWREYVKEKYR